MPVEYAHYCGVIERSSNFTIEDWVEFVEQLGLPDGPAKWRRFGESGAPLGSLFRVGRYAICVSKIGDICPGDWFDKKETSKDNEIWVWRIRRFVAPDDLDLLRRTAEQIAQGFRATLTWEPRQ